MLINTGADNSMGAKLQVNGSGTFKGLLYVDKSGAADQPNVRLRTATDSYQTQWGVGQISNSLNFGLTYFNGSSWSSPYVTILTSGEATFSSSVTSTGLIVNGTEIYMAPANYASGGFTRLLGRNSSTGRIEGMSAADLQAFIGLGSYVPYTGANQNVNLGANSLQVNQKIGTIDDQGIFLRGIGDATHKIYYKVSIPANIWEYNADILFQHYNLASPVTRFTFDVNGNFTSVGTVTAGGTGSKPQIIANGGTGAGAGIALNTSLTTDPTNRRNWFIGTEESIAGDFQIKSSSVAGGATINTRLAILSNGYVGINMTTPIYQLDVTTANYKSFRIQSSDDALMTIGSTVASSQFYSIGVSSATSGQGANLFWIGTSTNNPSGTLTKNFTLNATGAATFSSSVTTGGDIKNPYAILRGDGLEQWQGASDTSEISINYVGYNSGTAYFRNFSVYNGKGSQIFGIVGSTGASTFNGSLQTTNLLTTSMSGSAINIRGNETLNSPFGITWTTPTYTGGLAAIRVQRTGATDASDMIFYVSPNGDIPNERVRIDSNGLVTIGTGATTGTTELLRLRRNAGGWGNTTFKQSYNSTFFTNGKTLTLANDSNTDFAHFPGNNAGTRTDFYLPTGVVAIGTSSPQSGVTLDVRGGASVATAEGLRLGNVGDNTAYDNVKLYYTGFNGGAPRIYLTPRTTPGSGVVNTFFHLLNSNGASTTSNNTMGLIVDGSVGIGGAPTDKLEVVGEVVFGAQTEKLSMGSASLAWNRKVATGTIYDTGRFAYQFQHTGSTSSGSDYLALQVYNNSGGNVTTSAIAINGVGNTLLGTTSDNSHRLRIEGNTYSSGYMYTASEGTGFAVDANSNAAFARVGLMKYGGFEGMLVSGSGTVIRLAHRLDSDYVLTGGTPNIRVDLLIATSGAATFSSSVTATSFFESSDLRLKSNILDLDIDASSILAKRYIKDGVEEIGYIAQDVEGILPSAISKREDGYLDLSYRQVHTAKIAALEKEIAELKKQLKNK